MSEQSQQVSNQRPVVVFHETAGAVVEMDGRWVLIRRGREWLFPKGHLERGESPADAAVREVKEETGLEIRLVRPLGSTRYAFSRGAASTERKKVHWFLAGVTGGTLGARPPFSEARLATPSEALRLLTHDQDRELARRIIAENVGDATSVG
jgi:diadenosine hexaphosphate hydrolase (ATP-forming)